jgi:hypothetical protein
MTRNTETLSPFGERGAGGEGNQPLPTTQVRRPEPASLAGWEGLWEFQLIWSGGSGTLKLVRAV